MILKLKADRYSRFTLGISRIQQSKLNKCWKSNRMLVWTYFIIVLRRRILSVTHFAVMTKITSIHHCILLCWLDTISTHVLHTNQYRDRSEISFVVWKWSGIDWVSISHVPIINHCILNPESKDIVHADNYGRRDPMWWRTISEVLVRLHS